LPTLRIARKSKFALRNQAVGAIKIRAQKYSACLFPKISNVIRIPPRPEGRFAIVTKREAGCGGRERAD
jgi:hypothetical protein